MDCAKLCAEIFRAGSRLVLVAPFGVEAEKYKITPPLLMKVSRRYLGVCDRFLVSQVGWVGTKKPGKIAKDSNSRYSLPLLLSCCITSPR
jgi:hypothetical protein